MLPTKQIALALNLSHQHHQSVYIDKRGKRLCIYTDGHTYHERTQYQAQRDRNIDRTLQELGYQVLRYTGKEINENIDKVVGDIKKWIE